MGSWRPEKIGRPHSREARALYMHSRIGCPQGGLLEVIRGHPWGTGDSAPSS